MSFRQMLKYFAAMSAMKWMLVFYVLSVAASQMTWLHKDLSAFLVFGLYSALYILELGLASIDQNEVLCRVPKLRRRFFLLALVPVVITLLMLLASRENQNIVAIVLLACFALANTVQRHLPGKIARSLEILRWLPVMFAFQIQIELSPSAWYLFVCVMASFVIAQYAFARPWRDNGYRDILRAQGDKIGNGNDASVWWLASRSGGPHSMSLYFPMLTGKAFLLSLIATWFIVALISQSWETNPFMYVIWVLLQFGVGGGIVAAGTKTQMGWYSLRPGKGTLAMLQRHLTLQTMGFYLGVVLASLVGAVLWQLALHALEPTRLLSLAALSLIVFIAANGILWWIASTATDHMPTIIVLGAVISTLVVCAIFCIYTYYHQGVPAPWPSALMLVLGLSSLAIGRHQIKQVNWI